MVRKKILLIDDHNEFRTMLRMFIEKEFKDIELKEATTGEEGIEMAKKEMPHLALIDIRLPQMDGIQAAQQIKRYVPECQIVTMSMFQSYQKFVTPAIVAFINKDEISTGLAPLLHKLLNNGIHKQGGEE